MTLTPENCDKPILAIGECMAELAPAELALAGGAKAFQLGFAGDTFNTLWYLAQIWPEVPVSFCSAVGDDAISRDMLVFFTQSGIAPDHVRIIPNRTIGLYLISLCNGERSFSYWRGQSAARQLADDPAALARAIDGAGIVYFSGITLAILPPAARETLIDALKRAREMDKTVVFDPNLRPRLWAAPEVMKAAIMGAAAVSDLVLPSFEDESAWFGDQNPRATAKRYADAGACRVVVKNGAGSVTYCDGAMRGEVSVAPLDNIVDTTAAGDSFNAAILAGIRKGNGLRESIETGCRLAGAVVQGRGALVSVDPIKIQLEPVEK